MSYKELFQKNSISATHKIEELEMTDRIKISSVVWMGVVERKAVQTMNGRELRILAKFQKVTVDEICIRRQEAYIWKILSKEFEVLT